MYIYYGTLNSLIKNYILMKLIVNVIKRYEICYNDIEYFN